MNAVRVLLARLRGLVDGGRGDRGFDEELQSHLQLHVDDNLRAGMSAAEARRAALVKLGGLGSARERYHDQRSVPWMEHLGQDARFALRQLRRQPIFTATAVVALSLGLAAAVAIFGFVDAALLRPLPYPRPDRLVFVTETTPGFPRAALSYPDFEDWRRLTTTLSSLEVFSSRGVLVGTSGGAELEPGARVSAGFFRTLGITPILGRDFRDGDDAPGAAATVILGYGTWQTRFGADPAVVGRLITLDTRQVEVIGVLPRAFQFAPVGAAGLWMPLQPVEGTCDVRRSCHGLSGIARLRDGVSATAARDEMAAIARRLEAQYPESNRDQGAYVEPLPTVVSGDLRPILLLLLGGAALLLVVACVDVASLLLVRSEQRRPELAMRRALGASRGRLLRQLATEAAVLCGLAAATATAVVALGLDTLTRLLPTDIRSTQPALAGLTFNSHMLAAAAGLAVAAALLLTMAPLARMPGTDRSGVAGGGRGSVGGGWRRFGFRLVVVELALATVLLAGAGLLGRSLQRLLEVDLGFRPDAVVALRISAPPARYRRDDQAIQLAHAIVERIARLPGVDSVGLTSVLPVTFNGNTDWIRFVGRPFNGEHNEVNMRDVSQGYFATIGATVVRGRDFSAADTAGAPRVAIINRALARRYFGDRDPIGTQIGDTGLSPDSIKTIVGIVDDVREGPLDADIWPAAYYPFDQDVDRGYAVVARTSTGGAILPAMAAAVGGIDPDVGRYGGTTLPDRIATSPVASLRRSVAWLVGGFAACALALGVVGLYGVVAYWVDQRRREIGVRLALGATRQRVAGMVLRESARLAGIGIGLGLGVAIVGAWRLPTLLFETAPWDAATLAVVASVLGLSTLVAGYLPARRAAAVDPIQAIRE